MTQALFHRYARLKVGRSAKGVSTSLDSLNPTSYEGLRITFDIVKNTERDANQSKISIYNLSKKSRAEMESNDLRIALEVGYIGLKFSEVPLVSQIFIGDIMLGGAKSERRGADIITTFESGDAEVAITETTVNESFAPNTSLQDVIKGIAKELPVAIGTIMPGIVGMFANGLTVSGLAADQLDILTKKAGLEWHINDGELNILEPKLTTPEEPVLVSRNTGLIGTPSKKQDGYEFESLINPLIRPGRGISLVSANISGLIKAVRVTYTGDTHGNDWKMTVECK